MGLRHMASLSAATIFDQALEFIKQNLVWVIVIAAAVVVLIIVIIVACVLHSKNKKRVPIRKDDEEDGESEARPAPEPTAEESVTPPDEAEAPTEASEGQSEEPAEPVAPPAEPAPVAEEPPAAPPAEEEKAEEAAEEPTEAPIAEEKAAEPEPVPAPEEKAEPVPAPAAQKKAAPKRLMGKWTIEHKGDGEFVATLAASNGEVMLTSEAYSSADGARSGIATIIKGVASGKFVIYRDKNDNYYYKLKTQNNRLLCVGEIYRAKDQCERAVESVKRIAPASTIEDEISEGAHYVAYKPAKLPEPDKSKGARGKWKVEKTEDGKFSAKLYASNGQLMLATEEVATRKSAETAIESVRRNATQGNFIIDRDKFGRYYYKLRNPQRSVICIGEAYEKLDSCVSAIESVRRFALTATMPGELPGA